MLHRKTTRHSAAIVSGSRLRMRVSREHHAIRFINPLHNSRAAIQAGFSLREDRRRNHQSGENDEEHHYGEQSQFAN